MLVVVSLHANGSATVDGDWRLLLNFLNLN